MSEQPPLPTLVLVRDMLFSTKIAQTATSLGLTIKLIRDPAKLASEEGSKVIVDLNLAGATEAASAWQSAKRKPVIGFVSHVDADVIAAARAAGITQILPRSRFVEVLPELLNA